MVKKNKTKRGQGWLAIFIPLALLNLGLLIFNLIYDKNIAILNPKGLIAHEQFKLFMFTTIVLLAVTLPVMFLLYFTAWKYRDSNTKAVHDPEASQGKGLAVTMWAFPVIFLVILSIVMVPATHRLEPRKTIASDAKPLTIQVVAMRWKWLFIYPEQNIATVNFAQIPVDRPVTFELTADEAPMSSFWVPNLGGQLYAMTSHVNRLNIIADETGDYPGSSAEINGAGFADMKFTARASSNADFNRWVNTVKQSKDVLSSDEYADLLKPSEKNSTTLYSSYQTDLYVKALEKYSGSHEAHTRVINETYQKAGH